MPRYYLFYDHQDPRPYLIVDTETCKESDEWSSAKNIFSTPITNSYNPKFHLHSDYYPIFATFDTLPSSWEEFVTEYPEYAI